MKFDLLHEPWLPAVDTGGKPTVVGLLSLFDRAHELRELTLETPDVTAAVYRMLLAILHRAYAGPKNLKEWKEIWKSGRFDSQRVRDYLIKWQDRFDLWDAKHPFLQDPTISLADPEPVSRLFFEKAQGNNPTLFDHTLDAIHETIDAATAARRLLGIQLAALGGRVSGGATPAVASPFAASVSFFVVGENLFQTLTLNLHVYAGPQPIPSLENDAPSWECTPPNGDGRAPKGHLDLMTWRPRRWLLQAADQDGRVICGVGAGGEGDRLELAERGNFRDPFAAYRVSTDAGFVPLKVDPERALWRNSLPLFSGDSNDGLQPAVLAQIASLIAEKVLPRTTLYRLLAVGYAIDKAKKRMGREEAFSIPGQLLLEQKNIIPKLQTALKCGEEVASTVRQAVVVASRHSLSVGDRTPDTKDVASLVDASGALSAYWSEAGMAFPHLILDLAAERTYAVDRWNQALRAAAYQAFACVEIKLGASSRGFKALTRGRQKLGQGLRQTFPLPPPQELVTP